MNDQRSSDVIVIGGGHNGLVAANYLARAGKRVTVVEARPIVGGACVSEEFFPGTKFSSCAFVQAVLRPKIAADLELAHFGLEMYAPDVQGFALFDDGSHLLFWKEIDKTLREIEKHSVEDARSFLEFGARLRRYGEIIGRWLLTPPPSRSEVLRAFEEAGEQDLLNEFMFASTRDLLDRYFKDDHVKGFLTFLGIVSIWGGPSTPGTAYLFGHHASGEFEGTFGRWAFVKGGMGGITQALARGLQHHGGTIRVGQRVRELLVADGRAAGVILQSGETLRADVVLSNADPRRSFLELVDHRHLDPAFRRQVERIDTRGTMARIHLLLDELPAYVGFDGSKPGPQHRGHAILGCSVKNFEIAYAAMLRGVFPDRFVIEATIQSATDPSVAPPGMHTMILGVQNLSFELAEGTWDSRRDEFAELVLQSLHRYAPNVRDHIRGMHVITPLDLEREYGLTGGNIFQAAMVIGQAFGARPLPALSGYRTPIPGYYLCGAGTHPGGGVMGAPGHNAAHAVLADLRGETGRAANPDSNGKPSRGLIDRVLETSWGARLGYLFARNRLTRPLTMRGARTRKR